MVSQTYLLIKRNELVQGPLHFHVAKRHHSRTETGVSGCRDVIQGDYVTLLRDRPFSPSLLVDSCDRLVYCREDHVAVVEMCRADGPVIGEWLCERVSSKKNEGSCTQSPSPPGSRISGLPIRSE